MCLGVQQFRKRTWYLWYLYMLGVEYFVHWMRVMCWIFHVLNPEFWNFFRLHTNTSNWVICFSRFRGVYDLHHAYSGFLDIEAAASKANIPWLPIDTTLQTSFHRKFQRITATFTPKGTNAPIHVVCIRNLFLSRLQVKALL